jgi:glycerol-3-phosphate acyltransferase PlsY
MWKIHKWYLKLNLKLSNFVNLQLIVGHDFLLFFCFKKGKKKAILFGSLINNEFRVLCQIKCIIKNVSTVIISHWSNTLKIFPLCKNFAFNWKCILKQQCEPFENLRLFTKNCLYFALDFGCLAVCEKIWRFEKSHAVLLLYYFM